MTFSPEYVFRRHLYDDMDELSFDLKGWDLDFAQLKPGEFSADTMYLANDEYEYIFSHQNVSSLITGTRPVKGFQYTIPLTEHGSLSYLNYSIQAPAILFSAPREEVRVLSVEQAKSVTVVVHDRRYYELLELFEDHLPTHLLPKSWKVLIPSVQDLTSLQKLLSIIYARFSVYQGQLEDILHWKWLVSFTELYVIPLLFRVALDQSGDMPKRVYPIKLQMALVIIFDHLDSPPTIEELAADLKVSPRNLQYLFNQYLGISPKKFINRLRLNAARGKLRQVSYAKGRIADVANELGYWHLGSFCSDFKRLFLKTPSEFLVKEPIELR